MKKTSWLPNCSKIVLMLALIIPLIEVSGTPAVSQGVQLWNKNCKKLYKKWEAASKHKAFATTNPGANPDAQACGYSWAYATKDGAENSAIAACKRERQGTCWIIRSE